MACSIADDGRVTVSLRRSMIPEDTDFKVVAFEEREWTEKLGKIESQTVLRSPGGFNQSAAG